MAAAVEWLRFAAGWSSVMGNDAACRVSCVCDGGGLGKEGACRLERGSKSSKRRMEVCLLQRNNSVGRERMGRRRWKPGGRWWRLSRAVALATARPLNDDYQTKATTCRAPRRSSDRVHTTIQQQLKITKFTVDATRSEKARAGSLAFCVDVAVAGVRTRVLPGRASCSVAPLAPANGQNSDRPKTPMD